MAITAACSSLLPAAGQLLLLSSGDYLVQKHALEHLNLDRIDRRMRQVYEVLPSKKMLKRLFSRGDVKVLSRALTLNGAP